MIRRLLDPVFAAVTGIPTIGCQCGFTTRCGYQFRLHSH